MSVSFAKCSVAVVLGGMLLLGANGCAPSQVTHHSGQIGRYYGDGVSFSVPVVELADEAQKEDKFWEVRQGIGGADVVVLGPFITETNGDNFRENMALSSRSVSGVSSVEQLRKQMLGSISQEIPSATGFTEGQDNTGCWVDYTCTESGKEMFCRAYFFYDSERSLGYALVGTVLKAAKNEAYLRDFGDIAATFRIGTPQSGFTILGSILNEVAAETSGMQAAPVDTAATPAEGAAATAASVATSAPDTAAAPGGNVAPASAEETPSPVEGTSAPTEGAVSPSATPTSVI